MQTESPAADNLHPHEQYDQVTDTPSAPETTPRTADDAGETTSAGMGAVESEMTPLTPPSANTDSALATASTTDDDFDPADEITPG